MSHSPFGPAPGPPPRGSRPPADNPFGSSPLPPGKPQPRSTVPATPSAGPRRPPTRQPISAAPPPAPTSGPRLKRGWRIFFRLVRLASPLALITGLVFGLLHLPVFRITSVTALGSQFTETELEEAFKLSAWEGRYTWEALLQSRRLRLDLLAHPRVADARVQVRMPGQLELELREKERYAALIVEDQAYIIATDFSCMGIEPVDLVPTPRRITGLSPEIFFDADGRFLRDPFPEWPPQPTRETLDRYYYAKVLQLWKWIDVETDPPLSQVAGIAADQDRGLTLHYRLGGGRLMSPILLGSGADLEMKYGQALTIYRSGHFRDRNDAEIDLRFNRSVVRTIGPEAVSEQQQWLASLPPDFEEPGTIPLQPAANRRDRTEDAQ